MNTKCKCGGTLIRWTRDKEKKETFKWQCPKCGHAVYQRKRKPYTLNADRDIVNIRRHVEKLLERNPITDKNRDEWKKFIRAYVALYVELNGIVEKVTITL